LAEADKIEQSDRTKTTSKSAARGRNLLRLNRLAAQLCNTQSLPALIVNWFASSVDATDFSGVNHSKEMFFDSIPRMADASGTDFLLPFSALKRH
jgi:hypothetical protein